MKYHEPEKPQEPAASSVDESFGDMMVQSTDFPYISKSRVKQYKNCPRSFFYTYVMGMRFDGNFYTKRGTRIHETFEHYYEDVVAAVDAGTFDPDDDLASYLRDEDVGLWIDWVNPFIHNFLKWERRRLDYCVENGVPLEKFGPRYVEAEGRLEDPQPGSPEWMGYADAVIHAAAVPEVDQDTGYVIVDFKTGKTPKEQYRDEGIFLEGEFYAALFENELEIAAVAGYYPMNDDFIIAPLTDERRQLIHDLVDEIVGAETMADFPLNQQPLCKWGPGEDQQCDHYEYCDSRWGQPGGPGPTYQ